MKSLKNLGILMMGVMFLAACSDDDDNIGSDPDDGTAAMSIRLVDAPGDYEHVYIDVQDVVVKHEDSETEISFESMNAGIYDLLELTGGNSALLVDADSIPEGDIHQIRLILGSENSVVVDGQTHPLQTPSAQQSGLKINVHKDLEDGVLYEFTLDFNVEESIVEQGNGGYLLKPVIRASLDAETGAIAGIVLPTGIITTITAVSDDGNTEVSTNTNAEGEFMLNGLPEGTYDLTFEVNPDLGLEPITIPDIQVETGLTTQIDDVVFEL